MSIPRIASIVALGLFSSSVQNAVVKAEAQPAPGKPKITVQIIVLPTDARVGGKGNTGAITAWAKKRTEGERINPHDILVDDQDVWLYIENTALDHTNDRESQHALFDKHAVRLRASQGEQVEWVSKTPFEIAIQVDKKHEPQMEKPPANPFGWEKYRAAQGSAADGYRLLSGVPQGMTGKGQRYKVAVKIGKQEYDPDLVCVP
jgi:hypothetical protein